jgi:hypothetical protein
MQCAACPSITRPPHAKVGDYPGTVQRYGALCAKCSRNGVPQPARMSVEYNLAGLNKFLARRREREARIERVRA